MKRKKYSEPVRLLVFAQYGHTIKPLIQHFTAPPHEGDLLEILDGRTVHKWEIIRVFSEHEHRVMMGIADVVGHESFARLLSFKMMHSE